MECLLFSQFESKTANMHCGGQEYFLLIFTQGYLLHMLITTIERVIFASEAWQGSKGIEESVVSQVLSIREKLEVTMKQPEAQEQQSHWYNQKTREREFAQSGSDIATNNTKSTDDEMARPISSVKEN